jgi:CDP-paratose 2-epimerase
VTGAERPGLIFDARKPVLITGGAGFIGTNLAHRLLSWGQPVLIFDSLARAGVAQNLAWLRAQHGARAEVVLADIRDAKAVRRAVRRACRVFHFAAQVAVTTSLTAPIEDFEVNARGTLNLLEAIRTAPEPPPLLFTSTNKVYGTLAGVEVGLVGDRYLPHDEVLRARGVDEKHPLDFHSPYGCSKGAADQYVLDYSRIYGLPAVVFRMSCIYGPHQRGNEDQGWVAHFLLATLRDEPITIYGDGFQVRDALHADDLIDAMLAAHRRIDRLAGRAFNIGGGVDNAITLRDLLELSQCLHGRVPAVRHGAWRTADQRYYVSSIDAFAHETDWRPRVGVTEGVTRLYHELRARMNDGAGESVQVAAGQG